MIRSTNDQLRDIREQSESGFACVHIDTCLPCYLQDHHNRDGELLLGVPVDGDTTGQEVKEALLDEFQQIAWDMRGESPGYDHDKAQAAIIEWFADVHPAKMPRPFDPSLDVLDSDEAESCESVYAYFLITWDVPDESD